MARSLDVGMRGAAKPSVALRQGYSRYYAHGWAGYLGAGDVNGTYLHRYLPRCLLCGVKLHPCPSLSIVLSQAPYSLSALSFHAACCWSAQLAIATWLLSRRRNIQVCNRYLGSLDHRRGRGER